MITKSMLTDKMISMVLGNIEKDQDGCWIYTISRDKDYDDVYFKNHIYFKARWISYLLFIGDLPDKFELWTKCNNKYCINPDHIKLYTSDEDRFWSFVNKLSKDDCWEWLGSKTNKGYGRLRIGKKKISSHRYSYLINIGSIDPGLYVCHKCDNPSCVNPNHLFLGTNKDNMNDRNMKNRQAKGENNHSKLFPKDVIEIRALLHSGVKTKDIAEMFKVNYSVIESIKLHRSWNHVT